MRVLEFALAKFQQSRSVLINKLSVSIEDVRSTESGDSGIRLKGSRPSIGRRRSGCLAVCTGTTQQTVNNPHRRAVLLRLPPLLLLRTTAIEGPEGESVHKRGKTEIPRTIRIAKRTACPLPGTDRPTTCVRFSTAVKTLLRRGFRPQTSSARKNKDGDVMGHTKRCVLWEGIIITGASYSTGRLSITLSVQCNRAIAMSSKKSSKIIRYELGILPSTYRSNNEEKEEI